MPVARYVRPASSKISYQIVFGVLALATMLLMTILTAGDKKYAPLEMINSVKKLNRSFSRLKSDADHLQLINGLQSYSIEATPLDYRPNAGSCFSNPSSSKKFLFADVNKSVTSTFECVSNLNGFTMPAQNAISLLSSKVRTDLVYSFSKDIVENIKGHFSDWNGDLFAISSAFAILKDEVAVVSRVWLNKERFYLQRPQPPLSSDGKALLDNYLHKISYDMNLKKIVQGSLLNLNIPNLRRALSGDGPLDPKVFFLNNRLHVMFNTAISDPTSSGVLLDRMFVHLPDEGPDSIYELKITNVTLAPRDKGWSPLLSAGDSNLYFIYRYDPLVIARCDSSNYKLPCVLTSSNSNLQTGSNFADRSTHLRGGSPFVEYMHPYYVSVGHGTFFTKTGTRYYTTNLILLNLQSEKIIYVSSDIAFSKALLQVARVARPWVAAYPFFFALGLHVSSQDELIVSGHFNDADAALIRINGVQSIFNAAIAADIETVGGQGSNIPPLNPGTLNKLLLRQLTNETGLEFASD